jgi:hypothetical protein
VTICPSDYDSSDLALAAKRAQGLPLNGTIQQQLPQAVIPGIPERNTILRGPILSSSCSTAPQPFKSRLAYLEHPPELQPHHIHSYSLVIMPSSLPVSFNPHGDHPFTNHAKAAMPAPPPPSKYPQGVPSAHVTFGQPQKPSSLPGTPSSPHSGPIPQYPTVQYAPPQLVPSHSASSNSSSSSVSSSKGIFTPYRPDGRGTPDLEDILSVKKKPTWSKK